MTRIQLCDALEYRSGAQVFGMAASRLYDEVHQPVARVAGVF